MANVSSSNGLEKYPKLRFKGFSEPWNAIRFGDIVDEYSDRTKEEDEDILLSAAIEGMFLNSELFDHQRGASNKGYKKIDMGTLVLSTQNLHLGNANVNLRFEHGMVSPAYKTYHIHDCSIGLIAEWVKSEKAKRFFYDATTVGASVCRRNVEWDTLYDQSLYLPSEAEQERLAIFLTALSTRIKKQTELIEHLKKYKRGVSNTFFNDKVVAECSAVLPFGQAVEINPKTKSLPTEFIYIDLESVESGKLLQENIISRDNAPSRAQRVLTKGDVLFQMVRPYQKNNFYFESELSLPAVASTGYAQIRCVDNDPLFVFEQISSDYFANEAMLRSTGTGYPAINADSLAEIPFIKHPIEEQRKIGKFLYLLSQRIIQEESKLEALLKVKGAMLQSLFI